MLCCVKLSAVAKGSSIHSSPPFWEVSWQKLSNAGSAKRRCLLAYAVKDLMVVCHRALVNFALLRLYSVPLCTMQATRCKQHPTQGSCAQSSLLSTLSNR